MKRYSIILAAIVMLFACKTESLEEQWEDCCKGENVSKVNDSTYAMLPTAFSPNGDGVNDILLVYSSRALQGNNPLHITIWNINDDKVFESNNIQVGWDGTYKGSNAAQGRYTFEIEWETFDLERLTFSGSVCLIRDCLPANADISNCQFGNQYNPTIGGFDTTFYSGEGNYPICN